MILEALGSGFIGGLLRLAPEVLKLFDRKNERAHELAMLNAEMEFARVRGEIAMRQAEVTMATAELDAVSVAIKEQGETARAAGWFVAALSALVRPIVTYWFVGLYSAVKIAGMVLAYQTASDWKVMVTLSWNEEDVSILSMILMFWFVGRAWDRRHGITR